MFVWRISLASSVVELTNLVNRKKKGGGENTLILSCTQEHRPIRKKELTLAVDTACIATSNTRFENFFGSNIFLLWRWRKHMCPSTMLLWIMWLLHMQILKFFSLRVCVFKKATYLILFVMNPSNQLSDFPFIDVFIRKFVWGTCNPYLRGFFFPPCPISENIRKLLLKRDCSGIVRYGTY